MAAIMHTNAPVKLEKITINTPLSILTPLNFEIISILLLNYRIILT